MARYQISTPENKAIDDVVDEMAAKAWKVLRAWDVFHPTKVTAKHCKQFQDQLLVLMTPYVKSYELCGISNICAERIGSTPWALDSHALDACPWSRSRKQ